MEVGVTCRDLAYTALVHQVGGVCVVQQIAREHALVLVDEPLRHLGVPGRRDQHRAVG